MSGVIFPPLYRSKYRLNSCLKTTPTWGTLKVVGGNMTAASSYMQSPLFFNAVFNSRQFTDPSANPVAFDANGWPTAAWQAVLSASNSGTNTTDQPHLRTGQMTLSTYNNCLMKTSSTTPCVLSTTGGSITGLSLSSDDGTTKTYTFTLSPTADTNFQLNGTQGISFLYIPIDGSTPYNSSTNPIFNPAAISHYSKVDSLRLMDLVTILDVWGGLSGIGKLGETKWNDAVSGRVPNDTNQISPYPWETVFNFINTISTSGRKPNCWLNVPGFADTDYMTNLATLANTMSVPPMLVEIADETWNNAYYFSSGYQYRGILEAQVIANYGSGIYMMGVSGTNSAQKITSVTSDSVGNITVTLNVPMSTFPQMVAGNNYSFRFSTGSNTSVWNSIQCALTSVGTNSFTFPTRSIATLGTFTAGSGYTDGSYSNIPAVGGSGANATLHFIVTGGVVTTCAISGSAGYSYNVGDTLTVAAGAIGPGSGFSVPVASINTPPLSSTLTGIFGMQMQLNDTNKIASVTSDGASPPNITVTTTIPLASFPFTIANGVKIAACHQQLTAWNSGTVASPVSITSTTSNSFTFPGTASTPSNANMGAASSSNQYGVFIGSVPGSGVGLDSDLVKSRPNLNVGGLSLAWYVRLNKQFSDAWRAVRPQDKFVLNVQAASVGFAVPNSLIMASYYGTLSSYSPPCSWLGGISHAPYNFLTSLPATVDDAFSQFTTGLISLTPQIEALSFWGQFYGIPTMLYEVGTDTQKAPALQIEISSDPRIQATNHDLIQKALQVGVKQCHAFQITPSPFVENNAQGSWGFQQTFTDTFTNLKMRGLLQLLNEDESYTNTNGTFPCNFLKANTVTSTGTNNNTSNASYPGGITYWLSSGQRDASWLVASNSAQTANFVVNGTDSVVGTQATITVIANGVSTVQGTVTLPHGGAGNSSSCTISASNTISISVPKGASCIQISFATGQGIAPGITGLTTV